MSEQKSVFVVMVNADMTEGRGPMLIECMFDNREEAIKYINSQSGPMGYKDRDSNDLSLRIGETRNGRTLSPWKVHSLADEVKETRTGETRQRALEKLTNDEKRALGLL